MEKIYIFDVDGTLTPSRRKMTEDFEEFFSKWSWLEHRSFSCSFMEPENVKK